MESRPKTSKATRICEDCGIMSVKYIGRKRDNRGISEGQLYVCEICDREYLSAV